MFSFRNQEKSEQNSQKKRTGANCFICGHRYMTERAASYHSVRHSQDGYFNCPLCEEKFPRYDSLVWHLDMHHKGEAPRCHKCGHVCLSFKVLESHCCSSFGGQPLLCNKCCTNFEDVYAFLNQHRCIRDGNSLVCPCCHSTFSDRDTFGGHLSRHLGTGYFSCKVCRRTFMRTKALYYHEKIHNIKRLLPCQHCEKSFKSVASVVKHHRQVHGPRNHKCHLCNKKFGMLGYLRQHVMMMHTRHRMLSNVSEGVGGGDAMQRRRIADLRNQQPEMSRPDLSHVDKVRVKKEMGSFDLNSQNGAEVGTCIAPRSLHQSHKMRTVKVNTSASGHQGKHDGIKGEEEDLTESAARPAANGSYQLRRSTRSAKRNLSAGFGEDISLFLTKSGRRIYYDGCQTGIKQPKVVLRDLYASQNPQEQLAASKLPPGPLSSGQNNLCRSGTRQCYSRKEIGLFSKAENIRSTWTCPTESCSPPKMLREASKRNGRTSLHGAGVNLLKATAKQSAYVGSRKMFSELPIFHNWRSEDSSDEELELPA